MAQFTVNPTRFDPYKNFKFRVKWDGRYVAGVSKVGTLKRSTEVVKHREGGDPSSSRKSPGRTEFDAITLERGVTHDTEFEKWANKVWNFGGGLGSVFRHARERDLRDFGDGWLRRAGFAVRTQLRFDGNLAAAQAAAKQAEYVWDSIQGAVIFDSGGCAIQASQAVRIKISRGDVRLENR